MVAGVSAPEESPSCTERGCLVKAREARGDARRQSRLARRQAAREQQRPNRRGTPPG